jgi:hypothetical protein
VANPEKSSGVRGTQSLDASLAAIAPLTTVALAQQLGRGTGDEVGAVLSHVANQLRRFDSAPGPLTAQVIAADLLESYRVARELERAAPRWPRGELLKEIRSIGASALIPWTPHQPVRIEDVTAEGAARPLFSRENIDRWLAAMSYRPPAQTPGLDRRRERQRPAEPVDSTDVHPFNVTFVKGKGGSQRQRLPWPLPPLLVPNAFRIDLVKGPGMSFLTRDGRVKLLAFLLEAVAQTNAEGKVYSSEKGLVDPEELAAFVMETAAVGVGRLRFEGPESAFRSFESAPVGYRSNFNMTDAMVQILGHYADIKDKFRSNEQPERKRGCGSIEWITELLKDVPHRHREMWIQDQMMNGRRVAYPGNLTPGMVIPAKYFLTKTTAEALGNAEHNVQFVGSFTANDRIIKTEDGRVWLVKEYERNLQAACQAVIELQGILTLSFILCSAIGAVLGGPLVSFLITAGDVAIDINEAGGIRNFIKDLKNHPLKAGLFMIDLLGIFKDAKAIRTLTTNPRQTLEASIRSVEARASMRQELPAAVETVVDEARLANRARPPAGNDGRIPINREARSGVTAQPEPSHLVRDQTAGRGTESRANPLAPRPAERGLSQPTATAPPVPRAPTTANQPADAQIDLTDAAKEDELFDLAKESGRRRPRERPAPPHRPGQRGAGSERARQRRRPGGGEKTRGQREPGAHPIRGVGARESPRRPSRNAVQELLGRSKKLREAAERIYRLKAGGLVRDIAEDGAKSLADRRRLLAMLHALPEQDLLGLAAVRRVLTREPVFSGATESLDWLDLLRIPRSAGRSDLLRLVARVEPVTESGLSVALSRALENGAYSLQGGLGHFHAAAHLADEYRGNNLRILMEASVVSERGVRHIDIRATIDGALQLEVEVKTYLGQLIVNEKVRKQIVKDLVRHLGDDWHGLRYLCSPNVREELHVFKQAVVEAFTSAEVAAAVRSHKLDSAWAFQNLLDRLDDTRHPMVASYAYAILN